MNFTLKGFKDDLDTSRIVNISNSLLENHSKKYLLVKYDNNRIYKAYLDNEHKSLTIEREE